MITLESKAAHAANLFYVMAGVSLANVFLIAMIPAIWLFVSAAGSGFAVLGTMTSARGAPITGDALTAGGIAASALLGLLIQFRFRWAMLAAMVFLAVDWAVVFVPAARAGYGAAEIGLMTSMMGIFHVLMLWAVLQALLAVSQLRTNESIARSLEVQHRLHRALEESDAPPPPAATFTTRWRPIP